MGAHLTRRYLWDASVEPDPEKIPSFPPDLGFPERKERGELSAQARPQIPRNSAACLRRAGSSREGDLLECGGCAGMAKAKGWDETAENGKMRLPRCTSSWAQRGA
jgi:hypothetical protein